MKAVKNYFRTSFEELSKITWPTKNQAVRLTIIVLVFCVLIAIVLGILDFLFNELHTYSISIPHNG
ncbi:preprotein translocase subunit SecE [Candidatus Peregrinibacteria bacterium]|nr:preprotein translocase subunit SecE [Candidatus Peregrinibacteria bacterium]